MFRRREEYRRRLPKVLQPFITWLTGVPYKEQKPLYRSSPWLEVLFTVVWLAVGLTLASSGADLITTTSLIA